MQPRSAARSRSTTTASRCARRCSATCAARNYDVVYLGYNADGRIGRINLTACAYGALGEDRNNVFTGRTADIRAFFAAAEPSATTSTGSASALSGALRQRRRRSLRRHRDAASTRSSRTRSSPAPTPATGSARPSPSPAAAARSRSTAATASSTRCARPRSRASRTSTIPGTMLLGAGADFDLTPELRLSANVNHLWFDEHRDRCEALRMRGHRSRSDIGWDLSAAAIWRPQATQNIVFRLSARDAARRATASATCSTTPNGDRRLSIRSCSTRS